MLKIGLVIANDTISLLFIRIEIQNADRRTKNHPAIVGHFGDIDDLRVRQLRFDILMNELYATYFEKPYPARSCVQVSGLPKGALVEIEMIAVL